MCTKCKKNCNNKSSIWMDETKYNFIILKKYITSVSLNPVFNTEILALVRKIISPKEVVNKTGLNLKN